MNHSLEAQRSFRNEWNIAKRKRTLSDVSRDQREVVQLWRSALDRTDLDILEVGCGSGWLCPSLKPFGRVTATDFSEGVLKSETRDRRA